MHIKVKDQFSNPLNKTIKHSPYQQSNHNIQVKKDSTNVQPTNTSTQKHQLKHFTIQPKTDIAKKEPKADLPDNLKAGIEHKSGISMHDVKVHRNSDKPADIGALAYAQGTNIYLGRGQDKHLAHEAWHVVQQKQGRVKPTMQIKNQKINNDDKLEHEASKLGNEAAQLKLPEHYEEGIFVSQGQIQNNTRPIQAQFPITSTIPTKPIKDQIADQYKSSEKKGELTTHWNDNRFLNKLSNLQKGARPKYSLARLNSVKSEDDTRAANNGSVKVHADVGNLEAALRGRSEGAKELATRFKQERKQNIKETAKFLKKLIEVYDKATSSSSQTSATTDSSELTKTDISEKIQTDSSTPTSKGDPEQIRSVYQKLLHLGYDLKELKEIIGNRAEKLNIKFPTESSPQPKSKLSHTESKKNKVESQIPAPYQGGHLIAYQFLEEDANVFENVVPQGQQLNNSGFQTFETHLNNFIQQRNRSRKNIPHFIEYRVGVDYPNGTYPVTGHRLSELGIIPQEHASNGALPEQINLTKFIPQRLYADAFLLDDRQPPLKTIQFGKLAESGNIESNQDFASMVPQEFEDNLKLETGGSLLDEQKEILLKLRKQEKITFESVIKLIPESPSEIDEEIVKKWTSESEVLQNADKLFENKYFQKAKGFTNLESKASKNNLKLIPYGKWVITGKSYDITVEMLEGISEENEINNLANQLQIFISSLEKIKIVASQSSGKLANSATDMHDPTAIDFTRPQKLTGKKQPIDSVGPFAFRAIETQPD